MKYTLTLDLGKACPGASHLDPLALLLMRQAATLDGLANAPRGDLITDETGAAIGAWQIAEGATGPHALAYFFDWEMTLTFWPDKASAEAACLAALNLDAETNCETLEAWQALDWGGRPWDYRISPIPQGPGLPHPSRADLLDAAGALREVAADRLEEADTLERYSEGDAQGLRDVAPLYEETADRLEAIARAMPKPGEGEAPPSADLEA